MDSHSLNADWKSKENSKKSNLPYRSSVTCNKSPSVNLYIELKRVAEDYEGEQPDVFNRTRMMVLQPGMWRVPCE